MSLVRSAAPGAAGFGVRRANASLPDCVHAAARGRGMGAHSRSLLLLVAAPLVIRAAGGARAAAGLRRAAHKATTAAGTAKTPGTPTPTQRVLDAMRLSLQRWAKVETKQGAQDYVRDILSPAKRGALGRILILNGRVFANNEGGKVQQHLAMVARAVREKHSKVKNVAYLHNSEASGTCIQDKQGNLLPTTLIAKKYSSKECGVLVPNPYFGDLDHWSNVAQLLEDASRKHPYWKRDPRAFWRGHIRWRNKDCDHESGNIARFLGTLLTLRHPDQFDVKVRHLEEKKTLWSNASALHATKCKDGTKHPFRGIDDGLLGRLAEAQDVSWVDPVDYARYKILAHFPGGTTGSYSRNLNHLWATGSTVMIWDHPAQEHYYAGLEEGRTHLVFNATNAVDVARKITGNQRLARRLRDGAAAVQKELVCADCLHGFLLETLKAFRAHFRTELALDDVATARATLKGVQCGDFVEYVSHGVVEKIPPSNVKAGPGEDQRCVDLVSAAFQVV